MSAASGKTTSPVVRAVEQRFALKIIPSLQDSVERRAGELVRRGEVSSLEEAVRRLESSGPDDSVARALRDAATIHETYFNRNPGELGHLQEQVARWLIEPKRRLGPPRLKVWSAGCSTGEEAYTLAALLRAVAPDAALEVVGTDVDAECLRTARAGVYGARSLRSKKPGPLQPYLTLGPGQSLTVDGQLKRQVRFLALDFLTPSSAWTELGLHSFDVIVCRNVLLYFQDALVRRLMEAFAAACMPTALLAITPAEYTAARHLEGFADLGKGVLGRLGPRPARPGTGELPARGLETLPTVRPVEVRLPPTVPAATREVREAPGEDSLESLLERAVRASDEGRHDESLRLARLAAATSPQSPRPYYMMAVNHRSLQDTAAAVRELKRALYLARDFVAAEIALAELSGAEGAFADAARRARRALKLLGPRGEHEQVEGMGLTVRLARRLAEDVLSKSQEDA